MNAHEAFDTLRKAAQEELNKLQELGARYLASADIPHARQILDQVEKVQELLKAVKQLQANWDQAFPLQATRPRKVLERKDRRTSPGRKTPQQKYWLPILQVLVERGGSGRTAMVIDRVGQLMADIHNDFDRERLPLGRDIRWRNTAAWARNDLVREGYLSNQSPVGIWEITEKGRQYLENRTRRAG